MLLKSVLAWLQANHLIGKKPQTTSKKTKNKKQKTKNSVKKKPNKKTK